MGKIKFIFDHNRLVLYSESATCSILIMQWNEDDRENAMIMGENLADLLNGKSIA